MSSSEPRLLRLYMFGNDIISELPESLLTKILSYLTTKESVRTSVLSTRWKNLWLNVPSIDLDCKDFATQGSQVLFINRYLQFNPESRLQKFKVTYNRDQELLYLKDRIAAAINRGIQYLDLKRNNVIDEDEDEDEDSEIEIIAVIDIIPVTLYTSKTLVSLKLSLLNLVDTGSVYMPCLKFMHLINVKWQEPMNFEKLISGCPVLEELNLCRDLRYESVAVTRIKSQSLKKFCALLKFIVIPGLNKYTLEIDAPRLEYMSLEEDQFDSYVVKNLSSLLTVKLDIKFAVRWDKVFNPEDLSKRNEIRDFLTGIFSVRHMIISHRTLEVFDLYSKRGPIPKFNNLCHLEVRYPTALLRFLPTLLESCPNLKHLILSCNYSGEMEEFVLETVPQCMLLTLECVEIKGIYKWREDVIKVVRYFLGSSSVHKKLILGFDELSLFDHSNMDEELEKLAQLSPTCQIIVKSI